MLICVTLGRNSLYILPHRGIGSVLLKLQIIWGSDSSFYRSREGTWLCPEDLQLYFSSFIAEKEYFFCFSPPSHTPPPPISKSESLVRDLSAHRPRLLFIYFSIVTKLSVSFVCKPSYAAMQVTQLSIHRLVSALRWGRAEKQNKHHLTSADLGPKSLPPHWQYLKNKHE